MTSIEDLVHEWEGEEVLLRYEPSLETWIFISIHSTRLGPAGGGTRILTYSTPAEGLADGMKLAGAMTRKMAVAGLPFGGGKAVLAVPAIPQGDERLRLLEAYASAINSLHGTFHTATDINSTEEDMNILSTMSRFIHGKGPAFGGFGSSGPPTAVGVFHGIRASVEHVFGSRSLEGRSVLIQGVGGVGEHLAELLREDGAELILCDIAEEKVRGLAERLGARVIEPGSEIETETDVFAPCAMGGLISSDTVDRLACKIVAGSANNQLADPEAAEALRKRGILYAPDYVINSGGAIHLIGLEVLRWEKDEYEKHLEGVGDTLLSIYRTADAKGITTVTASERLVEDRLAAG
ncbi:MAG: Glu/Leu/Phe/Val dehydrogenase dimerization domain-containing protein [Actinomycetota bacterium]